MVVMLAEWLVFCGVLVTVMLASAGGSSYPAIWAYVALCSTLTLVAVLRMDPCLARERMRPGPGGKDRLFIAIAQPLALAHWIVAGLDLGRFQWSGSVHPIVQIAGFAGLAVSLVFGLWAMVVNRFFSQLVRLQEERGHRVVTTGPYRFVRHPGYSGFAVACVCSGAALGSWWSNLPTLGLVLVTLRRTATEDRFLRERLKGYSAYAEIVRYRLVPGMW